MKKEKNKEEKSKLEKFKEIWANPRYKALIKLGLYAVFFLTLFLIAHISSLVNKNNVPKKKSTNVIDVSKYESYKYIYTLTTKYIDKEEVITYIGIDTPSTNSGEISYSDSEMTEKYVLDKSTNVIFINGIEKDKIFDLDEDYFSLKAILEKINESKKIEDGHYVYTDSENINIDIYVISSNNELQIKIDFNERYTSEILVGKELTIKIANIN